MNLNKENIVFLDIKRLKYSICIFLFLCIFHKSNLYGQPQDIVSLPPSPNAASLMEYSSVPVDYFTGIPKIDVPIYNLPTKYFNIPISLMYHASGIKVQDVASQVGLGWALNAGGAISRVVKGLPDQPDGYGTCVDNVSLYNLANNSCNSEPDIFSFNFLGRTGKFFLGKDGTPYSMPHSALKIEYDDKGPDAVSGPILFFKDFDKWTIQDEEGFIYVFGSSNDSKEKVVANTETEVRNAYDITPKIGYISTWYLDEIRSPYTGNTIVSFDYESGSQIEIDYYFEELFLKEGSTLGGCNGDIEQYSDVTSHVVIPDPKYISKVTTDLGTVTFDYDKINRKDLANGWYMEGINVRDFNTSTIERYELTYDYFNGYNSVIINEMPSFFETLTEWKTDLDDKYRRLKLAQIQKISNAEVPTLFREFIYNTTIDLPPRDNKKEDHWGFYNGRTGMYPPGDERFLHKTPTVNINGSVVSNGAKKDTYESSTLANILEQINYPLGGSDVFEYETVASNIGGVRIKSITTYEDNSKQVLVDKKQYTYASQITHGTPVYHYEINSSYIGDTYYLGPVTISTSCTDRVLRIYSSSYKDLFDLNGSNISYGLVTESYLDGSKIERTYSNAGYADEKPINISLVDQTSVNASLTISTPFGSSTPFLNSVSSYSVGGSLSSDGVPFASNTSNAWKRGKLIEEKIYNSENKLLSKTEFLYDYNLSAVYTFPAFQVQANGSSYFKANGSVTDYRFYAAGHYSVISAPIQLDRQEKTIYDQSDPGLESKKVTYITEYDYNTDHLQLSDVTEYNSIEVDKYVTSYRYAYDLTDGLSLPINPTPNATAIWLLKFNNVFTPLEISRKIVDGTQEKIIQAELNIFKKGFNSAPDLYKPYQIYSLKIDGANLPLSHDLVWLANNGFSVGKDSNFELVHTFNDYDTDGNVLEQTSKDGSINSFNWGYNNSLITSTTLNSGISGSQTIDYNHKPLVGLTAMTDPNGINTSYEYDSKNRLKLIKDQGNNILDRFTYHQFNEVKSLNGSMAIEGTPLIGVSIQFNALNTSTNEGKSKYIWDFGDGTIQSTFSTSITHVYSSEDLYSVKLVIENPDYNEVKELSSIFKVWENMATLNVCTGISQIDLCTGDQTTVTCSGSGSGSGPTPTNPGGGSGTISAIAFLNPGASCNNYNYSWRWRKVGGSWSYVTGSSATMSITQPSVKGTYQFECTLTDDCSFSYTSSTYFSLVESIPDCAPVIGDEDP